MTTIHPTAIVDPNAKLGENVEIGPFCIIGKDAIIGDGCKLMSSVVIDGNTTIGNNNIFFHSAVIGTAPQDLKYDNSPTQVIIADNNTFREFITVHRSALLEEPTRIGSNSLLMAYVHVAHNCQLGNNLIIANAVNLAGHVHIHDFATIGGITAVHQFVRIGTHSFVGGASGVKKDVPPYTRGQDMGHYKIVGLNSVGLMRKGFSAECVAKIKQVYKLFYHAGLNVTQALTEVDKLGELTTEQKVFVDFVRASQRGISKYN